MAQTWQEYCTQELRHCIGSGKAGEARWAIRRWQLFEEAQTDSRASGRIIIADLDARQANLRRYSFFSCYIIRSKFDGANLNGADFELAILRECSFRKSNLTNASFEEADIGRDCDFTRVTVHRVINFNVVQQALPESMDRHLRAAAETCWAVSDAARNEANPSVKLLHVALGYGLSIPRILASAAIIVALFSVLWMFSPIAAGEEVRVRLIASVVTSGRYFLGLSDHFANTFSFWAALGLIETGIGLFFLAALIGAISRRLTVLP